MRNYMASNIKSDKMILNIRDTKSLIHLAKHLHILNTILMQFNC